MKTHSLTSLVIFIVSISQTLHMRVDAHAAQAGIVKTFYDWLDEAHRSDGVWIGDREDPFVSESRKHASELLPKCVNCLSKEIDESILKEISQRLRREGTRRRSDEEVKEWIRARASRLIYALGRRAEPAVPELVKLLEDREWNNRQWVANAFRSIGPAAKKAAPIALEDLKSSSPQIRQHGVIIIAASANYDEEMVTELVKCTRDESEIVRQTAIWYLAALVFRSPQAAPCLFAIRDGKQPDSAYVSALLRVKDEELRFGVIERAKPPADPNSTRIKPFNRLDD
jgi:hypothetical protein